MSQIIFENPEVSSVFDKFPENIRNKLLSLRQLIFDTAANTDGVGKLKETLRWGEPSYITTKPKTGSTIRISWKESLGEQYGMYFICTTSLISTFRAKYPEFKYEGDRAIIFNLHEEIEKEKVSDCIKLALIYHLNKKVKKNPL